MPKRGGKKKQPAKKSTTKPDGIELRRLMSARAVNEAVEQFHVFSVTCDDANALYDAFSAYRAMILEALTLNRVTSGERLEADILLINAQWSLEQAGTTNNSYGLYLPTMQLRRRGPGQFEQPQAQEGVATYAVYAGTIGKSGVAVDRDVRRSTRDTRFWEPRSATSYKSSSVGDMYKPPPSGIPPYRAILSAPIMMTRAAYAVPTKPPETECIGVLNITHTVSVSFDDKDCAWAQTIASLIGSLHSSFFARFAVLERDAWNKANAESHANEVLLDRARTSRPSQAPVDRPSQSAPAVQKSEAVTVGGKTVGSKRDVTQQELDHERIVPWTTLRESDYLITAERLGGTEVDRIRSCVTKYGIALIRLAGHDADAEIIEALAKCFGPVAQDQNEVPGAIKSIKPVHEKPANTGDSAKALGAHVDGTQHESTPAILIFQYVHGADFGALSQFWDGAEVFLEYDKQERTRLMSLLAAKDAGRMSKKGRSYEGPLLTKATPTSVGFRFRIDDVLEVKPELKSDFEKLKARFSMRGLEYTPLKGDIAVFDNRRLLHGRDKVGGDEQREHRRMWIEQVHPELLGDKVHIGIRPVPPAVLAEIDKQQQQ